MIKGRTPILACGPFVLALLIAACGDTSVPSAEDNDQLDNAAEMLDSAPDALAGLDENAIDRPANNSAEPLGASAESR